MHRRNHAARARALAQILVLAVLFAFPHVAFAYTGETFLNYLGNFVIGPLALIAIVVAAAGAMLRPELVGKALWAAVVCGVVFFVIREGDTILNMLKAGS